jgi:hypothetical protein
MILRMVAWWTVCVRANSASVTFEAGPFRTETEASDLARELEAKRAYYPTRTEPGRLCAMRLATHVEEVR